MVVIVHLHHLNMVISLLYKGLEAQYTTASYPITSGRSSMRAMLSPFPRLRVGEGNSAWMTRVGMVRIFSVFIS